MAMDLDELFPEMNGGAFGDYKITNEPVYLDEGFGVQDIDKESDYFNALSHGLDAEQAMQQSILDGRIPFDYSLVDPLIVHPKDITSMMGMRAYIERLIAPRRYIVVKPPFAEAQLVIMALLLHDKPQTVQALCLWLFDTFAYYQDMARSCFAEWRHECTSLRHDPTYMTKLRIWETVWRFEMPVQHSSSECIGDPTLEVSFQDGKRVMGEFFGQNIPTAKTPADICNFFQLPAELRNMIYEFVFAYPQAGISPHTVSVDLGPGELGRRRMVLLTPSRNFNEPFDENAWVLLGDYRFQVDSILSGHAGKMLRTEPIADILDCLLTNRQFYDEAHPFFFKINHFYFKNPSSLMKVLGAIQSKQPKYVKCFGHISVSFDIRNQPGDRLKLLGKIAGLDKLEFYVDEEKWKVQAPSVRGSSKNRAIEDFTGHDFLRRHVRATEVLFHGCPTLERMLKAPMTKVSEEGEKMKVVKKRRVDAAARVKAKKRKTV